MSLNNIKQRIRDYSTTLTQANSGLSSDTSFLNDAMVDGAKDVVNRLRQVNPTEIPKFGVEISVINSSGVNSDYMVAATNTYTTYLTAAVTTTTQTALAVNDETGITADDYICIMPATNSDPTRGVEIMKVSSTGSDTINVVRGEFDSIRQTHTISGTPADDHPRIHKITKLVPIGDVIYAEMHTTDAYNDKRLYPMKLQPPHLAGKYEDPYSIFNQSKYNAAYVIRDNKIFVYPAPNGVSETAKLHVVSYGDILDFATDSATNTRDYFPEEHLNQVIMYAAIRTLQKTMGYMKDRLPTYALPAMNNMPDDITIGDAPEVDSPSTPTVPTTNINVTQTLGNITFPTSFPLEELDIGSPSTPAALPSFQAQPTLEGSANHTDTTSVSAPSSVTFPAAPQLPTMDALPEFPGLAAIGSVTGTISDIEITVPPLATINVGAAPTTPTGLSETFTAEWLQETISSYDGYTSWGHDKTSGTNTPASQWSFEHQMVVEEDPEMAALRLKQMEIEVDKFSKTQDTLARVYVAETQAYAEKIRAEIAKISGDATIAAEEARAKRTIMEAQASKVQAEAQIVQSEVQANQAVIQAYSSEVGAKVNSFASETKAKTDAFVGEVRGLTQVYQTEASFNVQKFSQEYQKDLQIYVANVRKKMQEYAGQIQAWQAEISSVLQRWNVEEWQTKVVKWQLESQVKIQDFQTKVGQNVQKYSQDIAKENADSAYEIKQYGAELQKLAQQNSLEMQKFNTEYQMKLSEWNRKSQWSMQRWQQDLTLKIQRYNTQFQKVINEFSSEVQATLQEHSTKIQNLNTEYQWCAGQMQVLMQMYNSSFVPYQQQQQQVPPQMVQGRR